jgi:hypothetical protein
MARYAGATMRHPSSTLTGLGGIDRSCFWLLGWHWCSGHRMIVGRFGAHRLWPCNNKKEPSPQLRLKKK